MFLLLEPPTDANPLSLRYDDMVALIAYDHGRPADRQWPRSRTEVPIVTHLGQVVQGPLAGQGGLDLRIGVQGRSYCALDGYGILHTAGPSLVGFVPSSYYKWYVLGICNHVLGNWHPQEAIRWINKQIERVWGGEPLVHDNPFIERTEAPTNKYRPPRGVAPRSTPPKKSADPDDDDDDDEDTVYKPKAAKTAKTTEIKVVPNEGLAFWLQTASYKVGDQVWTISLSAFKEKFIRTTCDQLGLQQADFVAQGWNKTVRDLGADSLDTVELVMAYEEAFSIELKDDEIEKGIDQSRSTMLEIALQLWTRKLGGPPVLPADKFIL
jgi:acyl carrier protein